MRWVRLIVVAALAALIWFFRTWLHGPVLAVYTHPVIVEVVLVWLLVHAWLRGRFPHPKEYSLPVTVNGKTTISRGRLPVAWVLSILVLTALTSAGLAAAGVARPAYLARNLPFEKIDRLGAHVHP